MGSIDQLQSINHLLAS